jgi:hypothetical protein
MEKAGWKKAELLGGALPVGKKEGREQKRHSRFIS